MYSFCSILARATMQLNKNDNSYLFFFCFGIGPWNLSTSAANGHALSEGRRIAVAGIGTRTP
jgi:hypothetical protein